MPYILNAVYLLALIVLSPWLAYKALTTGKYRRGLWTKLTGRVERPTKSRAFTVWFHGVSVGEIHLLRTVVAAYRRRFPEHQCVISTTTDTGMGEAHKAFHDCPVIYWPFDFTWAAKTALARVRPDLVVLAEGEVWPNFINAAKSAASAWPLINGRMSPRFRPLCEAGLARAPGFHAARCLRGADGRIRGGLSPRRCEKRHHHGQREIRWGLRQDRGNPRTTVAPTIWHSSWRNRLGSRQHARPWKRKSSFASIASALATQPNLRLILVPRQKERFDPVADLLERSGLPFIRRSRLTLRRSARRRHPLFCSTRSANSAPSGGWLIWPLSAAAWMANAVAKT